jgi:hypothetical protein
MLLGYIAGLLTTFIILIIYKSIIKPLYTCEHKWRYIKPVLIEEKNIIIRCDYCGKTIHAEK